MDEQRTGPSAGNQDNEVDVQVEHGGDGRYTSRGSWVCCVPCQWLRGHSGIHRAALTIASLLVTSLLVASPVLFLISAVPGPESPRDCHVQIDDSCLYAGEGGEAPVGPECEEPQCQEATDRLLASLGRGTDPCKDFYKFACGAWARSSPPGALSLSTLQATADQYVHNLLANNTNGGPFEKLGLFYKSCVRAREQSRTEEPMYRLLEELGGYLPPGALGPSDLTPLIAKLLRHNGIPLINLRLERDLEDRGRAAIYIDVPRKGGLLGTMFHMHNQFPPAFRERRDDQKESAAYTFFKELAEEKRLLQMRSLLTGFLPSRMTDDQKAKELQIILLFITTISKLYPREKDVVALFQTIDSYQLYNLTRLQDSFPFLKWGQLFEDVFALNETDSQLIYVMSPGYLYNLGTTIPRFHKRVTHNALLLLYARDRLQDLVNISQAPKQACSHWASALYPREVGALFVSQLTSKYFQDLENNVFKMLNQLKASLMLHIQASMWLDRPTKSAALLKLSQLKGRLVSKHLNYSITAEMMEEVYVDPDNFFANIVHRYRQIRNVSLATVMTKDGHMTWAPPFMVNAFYDPSENVIMIPLALLTQPTFKQDLPTAIPYSTVGSVLGHELMHAFDLYGARFDGDGNRRDLLSPAARLGLEARVDCVARQYSRVFKRQVRFKGNNINVQFDWNITRNENMADIGAIQLAYESWARMAGSRPERLPRLGLGPRRLFFLSAAQMYCFVLSPERYILAVEVDFHTPYPERVNGIMMNSPSFAEAYNCPLGSYMNPSKKCSTW